MLTERRYFKWNNDKLSDIKLGDDIYTLIFKNIVTVITKSDGLSYRYHNNDDIWVNFLDNKVYSLFFRNEAGYSILGIDPYSFAYPATDAITEHTSKSFEYLPHIKNTEELVSGDYLTLIFKDFIPRNIMITRK